MSMPVPSLVSLTGIDLGRTLSETILAYVAVFELDDFFQPVVRELFPITSGKSWVDERSILLVVAVRVVICHHRTYLAFSNLVAWYSKVNNLPLPLLLFPTGFSGSTSTPTSTSTSAPMSPPTVMANE